jgi:hypothetical protein
MIDQSGTYQTGYEAPSSATYLPGGGEDTSDASMKDRAAESAQAGKQAAAEVAQTAVGQAKEVAATAQDQAKNLLGDARNQLRSQAGEQHRKAVTNLRSLGDELRSMSSQSEPGGMAGRVIGQAADHAHNAANWLDGRPPEDVLAELRRLAQRRPGAFLLGALGAGVVAGRLTRGVVAAHSDDAGEDAGQLSGGTSNEWFSPPTGAVAGEWSDPVTAGSTGQWTGRPSGGGYA